MLVLSRRPAQRIIVGQDTVIEVLEVHGDRVRLGVTAPRDVTIHREEVFLRMAEPSLSSSRDSSQTEFHNSHSPRS